MSAIDGRVNRLAPREDFRKVFALVVGTSLVLVTAVVVSRRASGAFQEPVAAAVPCFAATLAALLSLAALALWRQSARAVSKRSWTLPSTLGLTVLAPLALGAALWTSSSALVGGYLGALATASLVGAIAIEDAAAGSVLTSRLRAGLLQTPKPELPVTAATAPTPAAIEASVNEEAIEEIDHETEAPTNDEVLSDPSLVQWMTRRRLANGGEVIEVAIKIELDPAAKIGVAHLSFVPALSCDPQAECHLLSDFDGRVRITAARSYGLRIEARQSGDVSAATVIDVAFSAQSPPAASQAAAA